MRGNPSRTSCARIAPVPSTEAWSSTTRASRKRALLRTNDSITSNSFAAMHVAMSFTVARGMEKRPRWGAVCGSAFAFEEAAQLLGARRVAELPERLRLDLADALARDVELL